ncbi:ABC transporter permease [Falsiroseomonas oryzae]|uniref:ABC transporter permease n=1 Tax=Falsiroseomonas oryzae TaxID=2766473 RepID=UPI0022EA5733|nr:ABC transporter permease [Roseomonas sp. MO-31]
MRRLLIRRLLLAVPTLLVAATIAFVLAHLAPGSPAVALGGDFGAPGLVEEIARIQGTDRPLAVIYVEWLLRLARGDLGFSFRAQAPVTALIGDRLGVTLVLTLSAALLAMLLGLLLGAATAARKGGRAAVATFALVQALPVYLVAQLLVLVFAVGLGLLPIQGLENPRAPPEGLAGLLADRARHLALPIAALGLGQFGFVALLTRARLREELGRLYVTTARARGAGEATVRLRHALPNALLPLLALFGSRVGALVGGALVVETAFALPGLGRLAVTAAIARDQPTVIGVVLVAALAIVLANLAVDLLQLWLDPRQREAS